MKCRIEYLGLNNCSDCDIRARFSVTPRILNNGVYSTFGSFLVEVVIACLGIGRALDVEEWELTSEEIKKARDAVADEVGET